MCNTNLDGWRRIWVSGGLYWDYYDCGEFVIRCTREARDKILQDSKLPLKIINDDIHRLLTDF